MTGDLRPASAAAGWDVYARLIADLDASGARYQLIEHASEGRTELVSALRGHDLPCAAKCLILLVKIGKKQTRYVLAVLPGDARLDLGAVKALLGADYVAFAGTGKAEQLAGSVTGTVLPFSYDERLELIADPALLDCGELYFNAGRLDRSIALASEDYLRRPGRASPASSPPDPACLVTARLTGPPYPGPGIGAQMNERTGTVADRLGRLGLQLPPPPALVAAFEPYVRHGNTIYTSGQIATRDGYLVAAGRLGAEVDLAAGQDAARACAVNVLAQLQAAAGSLDAVTRLVKLIVYVACTGEFTQQPQVADGAPQLMLVVLGAAGSHARLAIGVAAPPLGTPVEVEAIAQVSAGAADEEAQPQ